VLQGADASFDSLNIAALKAGYAAGRLRPSQLVAAILERIARRGKDPTWIELAPRAELEARAAELERRGAAGLPLYGIPFAIKDNIDCRGFSTTAACREFAHRPEASAAVVERLVAAGAIPVGKANLDQFATGLVGVRSPYGVPANSFRGRIEPGIGNRMLSLERTEELRYRGQHPRRDIRSTSLRYGRGSRRGRINAVTH